MAQTILDYEGGLENLEYAALGMVIHWFWENESVRTFARLLVRRNADYGIKLRTQMTENHVQ